MSTPALFISPAIITTRLLHALALYDKSISPNLRWHQLSLYMSNGSPIDSSLLSYAKEHEASLLAELDSL